MNSGVPLKFLMGSSAALFAVHGIKWTCSNGNSSSGFSVEQLVQQILDSHQTKPQPRTHNCLCTGTLGEYQEGIGFHAWSRLCSAKVLRMMRHETLRQLIHRCQKTRSIKRCGWNCWKKGHHFARWRLC